MGTMTTGDRFGDSEKFTRLAHVTIGDKYGADSDIYDFIGDWRYSQRGIGRHCG